MSQSQVLGLSFLAIYERLRGFHESPNQ